MEDLFRRYGSGVRRYGSGAIQEYAQAGERNPHTRSLSEDKQADLVEPANHGASAVEDILGDPNGLDEHRQSQELEDRNGRFNTILTVKSEED